MVRETSCPGIDECDFETVCKSIRHVQMRGFALIFINIYVFLGYYSYYDGVWFVKVF